MHILRQNLIKSPKEECEINAVKLWAIQNKVNEVSLLALGET